ncbi:uncharacterized protein LOC133832105 [Humulus lupulus]|uniref:uncharacterized protein LOC133832105 n=1 Tax=Humulus lupulus TaxID=3486 RepID=UPI002B4100B2|nr:uncharacterized protein LOC133832105 [Humulus lupulus]
MELENHQLRKQLVEATKHNEELTRHAVDAQAPPRRPRGRPRGSTTAKRVEQASQPNFPRPQRSTRAEATPNPTAYLPIGTGCEGVNSGDATDGEVPKQHPDVSQPPLRRETGVTIREPSSASQAADPPAPTGKGKKKATEPLKPLDESSDENGPSADGPSANVTPPPSPLEQQTPPTPVGSTPSPPTPTDQTQQVSPASTGGDISSHALRSVKDREMLTLTTGRLCSGAVTEQSRTLEQRHTKELKAAKEKYAEQLEAVLEEKNKVAEELSEKQTALDKAVEQRENFKESNRVNYREAKKLE